MSFILIATKLQKLSKFIEVLRTFLLDVSFFLTKFDNLTNTVMKKALITLILVVPFFGAAQMEAILDTLPKNWKTQAIYSLNGTQTSFVNWSAGGRNNISVLGSITASAIYTKNSIKWTNDLALALGGLQYIEKKSKEGLQKTDDKIDVATNLGYKLKEFYYLSLLAGFKTQMLDGFAFPNDSVRVSGFLAPAYINVALGIDYIPNDNFSIFVSPLAVKLTIVNDQVLANAGAFGVDQATYDGLGNVITEGKRLRGEFGAYVKVKYNKTLAKNIDLKSKLELFSNYAHNPQNIDVNAEALFNFKVNSWFSATLQWNLIYDDDIDIRDADGNVGPRTQFKSLIGLGVSYKMMNTKEK